MIFSIGLVLVGFNKYEMILCYCGSRLSTDFGSIPNWSLRRICVCGGRGGGPATAVGFKCELTWDSSSSHCLRKYYEDIYRNRFYRNRVYYDY